MSLTLADETDYGNQLGAFRRFLVSHGKRLKDIALATRGEFLLEDLHGEAWLMAGEIRRLRGVQIDFLDPAFQDLLLAYLYKHCVDFRERKLRRALRLDKPRGEADGDDLPAWIESLQASELSDPVRELIEHEAAQAARPVPPWHYCEAAAYVHLRGRYGGSMQRLADFLRISPSWCYRRYDRAMYRSRCLSLDIGAAGRDPDFALKGWRHFKLCRAPDQLSLNFGAKDLCSS